MTKHRLLHWLLAAAASASVSTAAAQEDTRKLIKAGADGRFETLEENAAALRGHPNDHVTAFRSRLDAVFQFVKAMPAVSSPPYPTCSRLDSWIERNDIQRVLMGSVAVHTPEVVTPGRCERRSEAGVEVALNSLAPVLRNAHATAPENGSGDWYLLPIIHQGPDFIELESEQIILFEPRGAPFKPVSLERYARHQLRQLTSNGRSDGGELGDLYRKRLAAWPPAEKASAACARDPAAPIANLEDVVPEPVAACPAVFTVMEVDRAYLDVSRPTSLQIITLSNPSRHGLESDRSWELRSAVWRSFKQADFRTMMRR